MLPAGSASQVLTFTGGYRTRPSGVSATVYAAPLEPAG